MSNGQSPRNLKQVSGFGDVLCELSALIKGSRYQFPRLPFLRAQDVLNIRFHSPQTDYSVSFQAIFGCRSYDRDR